MFAFVFDSIGGGEWLVLLAVILIVVGPKNLPSAARKMGQVMSKLRRAADEFKRQLMTMDDEMRRTADELKRDYIDIPEDSSTGDRAASESAEAEASGDGEYHGDDYPGQDYYGMTDENGLEVASSPDGEDAPASTSEHSSAAAEARQPEGSSQSTESQERANGQDTETT